MSGCVLNLNPRLLVSRAMALRAQGAAPKYALTGWSAIRADDGMVVFVLPAEEIVSDVAGSRCLLWAPGGAESAARRERYEHCARALQHGQAEALVAFAHGTRVDPAGVLAVRVERQRSEYWAKWGSAARVVTPSAHDAAEYARVA
ncbi:MAG TPA: hypothetical protein VJQ51_14980 [Burkholderiales bacterium]|nr:hypothetical protein [Burkholderiales bacterium]